MNDPTTFLYTVVFFLIHPIMAKFIRNQNYTVTAKDKLLSYHSWKLHVRYINQQTFKH